MITSHVYEDLPVYRDNLGHPRGSYVEDASGERRSLASLFVHLVIIIIIVFIVRVLSIIFIITLIITIIIITPPLPPCLPWSIAVLLQ